ncbi:putative S-adenosyl-L-methionine-dependent methyltransferase [Dioscorea sansibarensis]
MWRRGVGLGWHGGRRWCSSVVRRHLEDEGDWSYASEWWGSSHCAGDSEGHTVFRSLSDQGNGVVSVVAYPSSRPAPEHWPAIERWLQERNAKIHPEVEHNEQFKILGYQWRVLRFNDNTRQSTAKIMAACRSTDYASIYLMQQPFCLAVPYLKSMASVGLTTLASSGYDLLGAVMGERNINVLCIGHGGGALPLFVASKIRGATVHSIEIDPVVISASVQAMGFPASALKETANQFSFSRPHDADQILWAEVYDRIFLYRSDAEDFMLNSSNMYDLVFIDAYDGDDIFPRKLWDPDAPFLKALRSRLHPEHGTIVVNLHSDSDVLALFPNILPMGKYVSQVARAYKEQIGLAFTVSVPWLCNTSLVAFSGVRFHKTNTSITWDALLNGLISKSNFIDSVLDLPFPSLQYIKRGFVLVE